MDDKKKQQLKKSSDRDKKVSAKFTKILLDRAKAKDISKKK